MLGNLYVKTGISNHAIEAYQRALSIDPSTGCDIQSGARVQERGPRRRSARRIRTAVALDPRDGRAQFQLADLAMRRGDFTQAEATLTRALAHEVDRPPFLVKLGECYIELKRWDDADRALRAALAERGDIERAHYDLALVLEARGDTPGAIAEYEAELVGARVTAPRSTWGGCSRARAGRARLLGDFAKSPPPTHRSRLHISIWQKRCWTVATSTRRRTPRSAVWT